MELGMAETLEIRPRRASLPTVPETQMSLPSAVEGDETPHPLDKPRLTWSVDLGEELRAMSTFELWYALNTGDLPPEIRVWRLGREAWTAAREVPELACALRDGDVVLSLDAEIERVTMDYRSRPPSFGEDLIVPARESTPPEDLAMRASCIEEIVLPAALRVDEPFVPAELAAALVAAPMPTAPTLELVADEPQLAAELPRALDELPSVTPPSSYVREILPSLEAVSTPPKKRALARWRVGLAATAAAALLVVIGARGARESAAEGAIAAQASGVGRAVAARVSDVAEQTTAGAVEPAQLTATAGACATDLDRLQSSTDPVAEAAVATLPAPKTKKTTQRAPKRVKVGAPTRTTKPAGQKRQHRTGRAS
jgi:hypothetical protein